MSLNATECHRVSLNAIVCATKCHELRLMSQAERNAFVRAMQTLQYHSSWQGSTLAVSYEPRSSGDYELYMWTDAHVSPEEKKKLEAAVKHVGDGKHAAGAKANAEQHEAAVAAKVAVGDGGNEARRGESILTRIFLPGCPFAVHVDPGRPTAASSFLRDAVTEHPAGERLLLRVQMRDEYGNQVTLKAEPSRCSLPACMRSPRRPDPQGRTVPMHILSASMHALTTAPWPPHRRRSRLWNRSSRRSCMHRTASTGCN